MHRLSNVHKLVTGPRGTKTRKTRVVRGPVVSGFGRNVSILRCFVTSRNTHGNLTSATVGATSTKCLAQHLISISRSIVIGRRSYNALHKLRYHTLGGNSRIVSSLCSHVLKHIDIRSVVSPRAKLIVYPSKRRVGRTQTGTVRRTNVRVMRVQSILAYRDHGNVYIGYCNEGLTARHVIREKRTIKIVTTRTVNRPNARLALHAFRTNNITNGITTGTSVATGRSTQVRFRRLHAIPFGRGNHSYRVIIDQLARIEFVSAGANVAVSGVGIPCKSALCIGRNSVIPTKRLVTH